LNRSPVRLLGRAFLVVGIPLAVLLLLQAFAESSAITSGPFASLPLPPASSEYYYYGLLAALFLIVSGFALLSSGSRPRLAILSAGLAVAGVALIYLGYLQAAFRIVDCSIRLPGGMCGVLADYDPLATIVGSILTAGGLFGAVWPQAVHRPNFVLALAAGITVTLVVVPSFSFNYLPQQLNYGLIAVFLVFVWLNMYRAAKTSYKVRNFAVVVVVAAAILFVVYAPIIPLTVSYSSVFATNCELGQQPCPSGGFPIYASPSFALSGIGEVYIPVSQTFMTNGWYWSPYLQP